MYLKVWVYLLTKAQHSEYKGLKRGQVLTSIPDIIEGVSWRVGARIERPTKDQVFQVLEFLRGKAMKSKRNPYEDLSKATPGTTTKETMITTAKATHHILITIDNYAVYQDLRSYESNDEGNDEGNDQGNDETDTEATREQRQPDNINKNGKNVNNGTRKTPRQRQTYAEDSQPYLISLYLHERIMKYAEGIGKAHLVKDANLQAWADDIRKMIEIDMLDTDEVREVIEWATSDKFWQRNILSASKLREKYSKLGLEMANSKNKFPAKPVFPNGGSLLRDSAEKIKRERGEA